MYQEIFTHLFQNKLRTALTGLSVSVGIFLLIFLLGAGNGLIHAFETNAGNFASDVVNAYPGYTSEAYKGWGMDRQIQLDQRDVDQTPLALPDQILESIPFVSARSSNISYLDKYVATSLEGVHPRYADFEKYKIVFGRYINDLDCEERRKSIVITEKIANELFGNSELALGQEVRADSLSFTVVGIRSNQGDFGEGAGHIPYTTARVLYRHGNRVGRLIFRTQGIEQEEASEQFKKVLRRSVGNRHEFSPNDESALYIYNSATGAKESARAMGMLRTALWVIGLLTLLSGVVSISNIMLITVKERTHEFGIRKALGATPWSILRSVLTESVIITAFFGYIGLVVGVVATEWLNHTSGEMVMKVADNTFYTFLDPTVDLGIAVSALVVLIVSGLIAGFFPARKAVKVKPIEALNAK